MIRTDALTITPVMLSAIAEIEEFRGAWRAIGSRAPERLSALRRVATIESIGSSTRIEGSKLSDRDVERLLSNLEIRSFETRDEQEVAGYAEVMEMVFEAWREIAVTENHIRQLHRDLLRQSTKTSAIAVLTRRSPTASPPSTRRASTLRRPVQADQHKKIGASTGDTHADCG